MYRLHSLLAKLDRSSKKNFIVISVKKNEAQIINMIDLMQCLLHLTIYDAKMSCLKNKFLCKKACVTMRT